MTAAVAAHGPNYVPRTRHRRADGSPLYTNPLVLEASPYLQQHAHNPVNWYPYAPNRIVSIVREGADLAAHGELVPLVRDKRARGGKVTAYVCENRVCDLPTSDPETFARLLRRTRALGPQTAEP